MAKTTRCTRLDPWLDEWLAEFCQRRGSVDVSEGLRRLVLESWVVEGHSGLEYREHLDGLRLGVRRGPDAWEVFALWTALGEDNQRLGAHFGSLVNAAGLAEALEVSLQAPRLVEPESAKNAMAAGTLAQLAGEPHPTSSLLLDWRVPASARARLKKAGLDARHVGDLTEPPRNPGELLALARAEGWTLVTAKYAGVGNLVFPMLGKETTDPPVLFISPDRDPADEKGLASDLESWVQRKPAAPSGGWAFGWLA